MNLEQLSKFLVKAKISTYASFGETGKEMLVDGGKEFSFEQGEFRYRDRYFGSSSFIGEEIVFQDGKVIWGMNYYGGDVSDIISSEKVYDFLKEALKKVTKDKPFRGPDNFKKDDFEYINKPEGRVERFSGQESILYKGELVHRVNYQGGLIK
jgi:hypothetical protein